jgi:hypothetical protein
LAAVVSFGLGGTALAQAPAASGAVITIAGNGVAGFSGDGGPATNAMLNGVHGLAVGPDGTLYFADTGNYRIRAVDPVTGIVRTIAGTGIHGESGNNGPATNAALGHVISLAADRSRNALYVPEWNNNWVRKVNLPNGLLTVYAGTGVFGMGFEGDGGPASAAYLNLPETVALDAAGKLFIGDVFNQRIRQVDPVTGIISTIAGDGSYGFSGDGGPATNASFSDLLGVAADSPGNVFAIDGQDSSRRARRIDALTGLITTIAGGGTNMPGTGLATNMSFTGVHVQKMAANNTGELYLSGFFRVFRLNLASGLIAPYAGDGIGGSFGGDGGPATNAVFGQILALAVPPGGGLIIADGGHARIRYVVPDSINLTNDSGQTAFYLPWVSALAGDLTIADNPNLGTIALDAVGTVAGAVSINDNGAAGSVDLSGLHTAGSVEISGNTSATNIDLGSMSGTTGSVVISNNPAAQTIALGAVATVGGTVVINDNAAAGSVDLSHLFAAGSVEISGNTSATNIDLGSMSGTTGSVVISNNPVAQTIAIGALETVGEAVIINDNAAAGSVDLSGLLTAASVEISGNTGATNVDLGSLSSVTGDVVISDNLSAQTIALGSISSVLGNATIQSNAPNANANLNSLTSYGCGTHEVTMTLDVATVQMPNGLTLCTNATLTGSTTVEGSVTNSGTIEPGSSPGNLSITGSLILLPGSRLRFELGGTTAGLQYDQLNISNTVAYAGTVNVQLINGFTPSGGQLFHLINAPSRLGAFASVSLPALPVGLSWTNRLAADGSIGVVGQVVPPQLLNPLVLGDGSFQFGFTNPAGTSFTVLSATNVALPLSNWTALGPPTELSPGQYQFIDPQHTNDAHRFYRVRQP